MKKNLLLLFLFLLGLSVPNAAKAFPFDVRYAATNYAASTNIGPAADLANDIWLGNLRGDSTWRDLIIANKASNTVTIRKWNSNGTFAAPITRSVGIGPAAVRSAELNGDKYEDIVVANSGTNTISVLLNAFGTTFFTSEYTLGASASAAPVYVAFADIDQSGKVDILTANAGEDSVSILLETDGAYVNWTNCPVGAGPRSVQIADFNGDGRKDILTANTNGTLTILPKQLDGTFGAAQTITLFSGGDPQPIEALLANINGDSLVDIITANYNSNTVSILTNAGSWVFEVATNLVTGTGPEGLLVRDINRDSRVDVAVACSDSAISIYLGSTNALFVASTNVTTAGSGSVTVAGSNLNGDLYNDLVVANNGNNTVTVLFHDIPTATGTELYVREDSTNTISLTVKVYPGRTTNYTIVATTTNGTLTGSGPTVTYVPDANFYGTDAFSFRINDGTMDSDVATVILRVQSVNDRPSFVLSTSAVTLQKFGIVNSYSGMIQSSSIGPVNEAGQTIRSYSVTTTNANFFLVKPTFNTNGVLSFKPSAAANGTIYVAIRAKDGGGILLGGADTSLPEQLAITFPSNPYGGIKGTYRGLFYEADEVKHESSGYFQATADGFGGYSGKVMMMGKSFPFSGRFDVNGASQGTINRGTNGPALTSNINIDLVPNNTDQITGTLTDGFWTAVLRADRTVFHATTNPAPQIGKYTMILPGSDDPETSPFGESYATVSVTASGALTMSGISAEDGRAFAQTAFLSKNGEWPLYVSLYAGKGSMLSWITFDTQVDSHFGGSLSWIKTSGVSSIYNKYYPNGFTNILFSQGSLYVRVPGERIISVTNAIARLDGGNLAAPLVNQLTLNANNTVINDGGEATDLKVTINTNGTVTGTFTHAVTQKLTRFKGIVFQDQNTIGGFFLGTNQSGIFLLESND